MLEFRLTLIVVINFDQSKYYEWKNVNNEMHSIHRCFLYFSKTKDDVRKSCKIQDNDIFQG